jgi:hypothetical protein
MAIAPSLASLDTDSVKPSAESRIQPNAAPSTATVPTDQVGGLAPLMRPTRCLIGWIDPGQIDLLFAGNDLPHYREVAQKAREAVACRRPDATQTGVLKAIPASLQSYVDSWRAANPGMAGAEWRCEMADLRQVFAAQPFVFTDHATERVDQLESNNLEALAAFTIPQAIPSQIAAQFDPNKQAFVFASPNPNLRILGAWNGQPVPGGNPVFGFVVGVVTSFMNVGIFRGRVFLRDGYHRALGLLRRGINEVPVWVREYASFEHLGLPQGMLPQDAYLGERPSRLPDYYNDEVAISADRPSTQKVLVIQANELTAVR